MERVLGAGCWVDVDGTLNVLAGEVSVAISTQ